MTQQTETFNLEYNFVVGVDLGTTNSAVAYVDLREDTRAIRLFGVPQLVAAGEVEDRSMLPSFLYLPGEYDLPACCHRAALGQRPRSRGGRICPRTGRPVSRGGSSLRPSRGWPTAA
ncbi:MAG: hypothetical protein R2856_00815 [Caldilineaceae bacterium]